MSKPVSSEMPLLATAVGRRHWRGRRCRCQLSVRAKPPRHNASVGHLCRRHAAGVVCHLPHDEQSTAASPCTLFPNVTQIQLILTATRWMAQGSTSQSTQNRSFRRLSTQPISGLDAENTKTNRANNTKSKCDLNYHRKTQY